MRRWLANEIYEHYLNGGLDAERDTVLEIVRQAALFIMDYLVEHDGCYVSCPSASPEAVLIETGAARLAYTARLKTVWRGRRL